MGTWISEPPEKFPQDKVSMTSYKAWLDRSTF
jgi:hypothetical protein